MNKVNLGRVTGKSAYEIWLEQGNTGTEQDFLNSLKAGGVGKETDPTVPDYIKAITEKDIDNWNSKSSSSQNAGISNVAKTLLVTILKKCYTAQNMDAEIEMLETELSKTVNVASISVEYNGGNVEVGTKTNTLSIVVTATYSDGTTGKVIGYEISPDSIIEGENVLTVTYSGKTATFIVTGIVLSEDATLTSISAVCNDTTAPIGTNASDLNIVVTGHYSDGTSVLLTGWTTSGVVVEGENTFNVSYDNLITTVTVTGVSGERVISSISVTSQANAAEINTVTSELKGMKVTANYSDGTSETLEKGEYNVTPDTIVEGTNVLIYSYEGKSATFNLNGVNASSLTATEGFAELNKNEYYVGTRLEDVDVDYFVPYTDGSIIAKGIEDAVNFAPICIAEGTNEYSVGLGKGYIKINLIGVNYENANWLENCDTYLYYYGQNNGEHLSVTNNNHVVLNANEGNGLRNRVIDISNGNINKILSGDALKELPTQYVIPSGATVETSVKWNELYSALPSVKIYVNPTGNHTQTNMVLLMEAYSTGLLGTTTTNSITVENETPINAICAWNDNLVAGKKLDFQISIKVNGVEILGGV